MKEETKLYYQLLNHFTLWKAEIIPSVLMFNQVDENGETKIVQIDCGIEGKRHNYNELLEQWETEGKKLARNMRNSKRKKLYKLVDKNFRTIYKALK